MRKAVNFLYHNLYVLILFLIGAGICLQSPFPYENPATMDSNAFLYIGKNMQNGLVPYKDMFDHKGPLIYFINSFGLFLAEGNKIGVWILELIFMEYNIWIMYKCAFLYTKKKLVSTLTVFVSIFPIILYFQAGNLVQEYALPFLLTSLYLFSKYFLLGYHLVFKDVFITGLCFAAVLLLQPNMAVLWVVFCIVIIFHLFLNGRDKDLFFTCIIPFLLGVILGFLPFMLYLFWNDALQDFWSCYITFNLSYTGVQNFTQKFETLKYFYSSSFLYFISFFICTYGLIFKSTKPNQRLLCFTNLLFLISSLLLVSISGYQFSHYGMVLIPCILYPVSQLFIYMYRLANLSLKDPVFGYGKLVVYILICCSFIGLENYKLFFTVPYFRYAQKVEHDYLNDYLQEYIGANTTADDKILVIGNHSGIYLDSNRQAASRYFYQAPIADVDDEITTLFLNDIENNNPVIVIDAMPNVESPFKHRVNVYMQSNVDNGKYKLFKALFDGCDIYHLSSNLNY